MTKYSGELLLVGPNSIKQKNEFKRMFAKSVNLSKVDKKHWRLKLNKVKNTANEYELKFLYENKLWDVWLVHRINHIKVEYDDLVNYNERSEKMFREEYLYGPKDKEGLDSLVNQVEQGGFGIDYYYPTILSRATYYWYTIATKQMFFNGNKRTALITALTYLENNGYQFEIYDNKELYNVSLKLARKEMSKDILFQYIQAHTILNFEWMESALCIKDDGQR
ncbi:type II toxin-antitoxin system death-on-curing family toxin [Ligilactobacillus aviarius]|uniref:type II toxin-antitoxin system death-on-curing family toxin n=1 Tax=Ligilactobacillus aviarius TaxID=1606 RepID=UPI0024BA72D4|nr:type II toxin-antitoxin system death-on-curing family toxin [Ligilactobacillus aviarius]